MSTKDVLKNIRVKNNLTQDEMAEKLCVTRQAVSRWENGDSTPNIETLKQISIVFDVSINTLLGSPRKLICQCCGMPLDDDSVISRETDNSFNEDYCKWCYTDGQFVYKNIDELLNFLVSHMSNDNFTPEQARAYFSEQLPKLKHWK
ncbi:MAG: zinc ribbon domain-containing protein [Eubacteriales bacterium]|nr:zinc ribbon domain-containing protein [Eubacteriales bacterium]